MAPTPLEGITVLSIEQAVAAPMCTARLAAAGARVIKVERPEGDFARGYDDAVLGESSYFVWLNRGKESVVLDLKAEADLALVGRILARADVFVQNLAPGAMDRLGLGSDALRERFPRLVTCDIEGYGPGPYESMKAYDFLVQCESGLVSITGAPGHPGRIGVSIVDIGTGMNAAQGVLAALLLRERTGRGSAVRASLFDTAADWMNVPISLYAFGGRESTALGMRHGTIAPYGEFRSADGQPVVISIQNPREWEAFCALVLGDATLATDPRFASNNARVANREALDALIAAAFGRLPHASLVEALRSAGTAFASVSTVAQAAAHPQLRHWTQPMGDAELAMVAPPLRMEHDTGRYPAVPAIGEHTAAIRAEFAD